jgi:hypothetical protein
VKFLSRNGDQFAFLMNRQERELFLVTLSYYPLLNPDYHRLTKNLDSGLLAEEQQLLRQAMEERHKSHKKQLTEFLAGVPKEPDETGNFELRLSRSEMEWLLTVLNDVRVGSWDILGRPDYKELKKVNQHSKNSHYLALMEMSGIFQSIFLHALGNGADQ